MQLYVIMVGVCEDSVKAVPSGNLGLLLVNAAAIVHNHLQGSLNIFDINSKLRACFLNGRHERGVEPTAGSRIAYPEESIMLYSNYFNTPVKYL